jgi:hypothetical protein
MARMGLSRQEALNRFWLVDDQGLITARRLDRLPDGQIPFARYDVRWPRTRRSFPVSLIRIHTPQDVPEPVFCFLLFSLVLLEQQCGTGRRGHPSHD